MDENASPGTGGSSSCGPPDATAHGRHVPLRASPVCAGAASRLGSGRLAGAVRFYPAPPELPSAAFVRGRRIEIPMTLSVTVGPKTWPAPWHGEVLLACRKCQKKLRKHPLRGALSKLKKIVKRRNREIPGAARHLKIGSSAVTFDVPISVELPK